MNYNINSDVSNEAVLRKKVMMNYSWNCSEPSWKPSAIKHAHYNSCSSQSHNLQTQRWKFNQKGGNVPKGKYGCVLY